MTAQPNRSGPFGSATEAQASSSWRSVCLNCATPLVGPFCSQCGQRAIPPHPTVRELAGDAIGELSGWDGKLVETLRLLITRPGELTRRFLDGRRVRYVSPIRLYLGCSLAYFLVASAAPNLQPSSQAAVSVGGVSICVWTPGRATGELTPAERDSALAVIGRSSALIRPVLRRVFEDPEGFRRSMLESMPRVLFALLPVFGAIVALFYRRRPYPEHLYFALHAHAFVFLALALSEASKFSGSLTIATVIGSAAMLWLLIYAALALRRAYGGSVGMTLVKGTGILAVYFVVSIPALFGLVTWAALTR